MKSRDSAKHGGCRSAQRRRFASNAPLCHGRVLVWHEAGGWALREALGEARAIVPAAKTVATLGARLIIPLGHRQAAYVRSHFGSAEMTIWDGPRRSEIVFGLAAATGGRVHARIGGLAASEIKGEDGLR
ncbi:amino acid synthesis family protein [Cupriavidus necator]|uniref:amino acid synthesis family protein n=1 Tax=Cupriavidus necator TaxID=106590 RepID=UPI0009B66E95|nr:amino acid synthesis family protein [Cupriavidus necator]MDX6007668.1 amino acid synthesis family protein [Cupriavidus necator]